MNNLKFRAWDKKAKKMITNFVLAPTSPTWSGFPNEEAESLTQAIRRVKEEYGSQLRFDTDFDKLIANLTTSDYTLVDWANYYGIENYEIMQWSGLLDKNGVEIFEGDIVSEGEEKYEVVFIQGRFVIEGGVPFGVQSNKDFNWYPHNFKVIGNKYEEVK